MNSALGNMPQAPPQLTEMVNTMTLLRDSIPDAFATAKANYLDEIEGLRGSIEDTYQKTLNGGFKQVYLTVTISSLFALFILSFYKGKKSI